MIPSATPIKVFFSHTQDIQGEALADDHTQTVTRAQAPGQFTHIQRNTHESAHGHMNTRTQTHTAAYTRASTPVHERAHECLHAAHRCTRAVVRNAGACPRLFLAGSSTLLWHELE